MKTGLKVVLVGLAIASLMVTVSAQRFGYGHTSGIAYKPGLGQGYRGYGGGYWHYYNNTTVSYDEIQQQAEDMLNGASTIAIKNWWGYTKYIIVKDNVAIGVLWQNVDLESLEIGQPFATPWFAKVPLVYNGQIVGMLNVPY